ncbi:MAG: hypothetical protein MJY97_11010 [Bacteroidales bacterium]|nr:hypothetical protein [Bacteroidales bacterium]
MKRFTDLLKIAAMSLVAALFVGSCRQVEPENTDTGKEEDTDAPFIFTKDYDKVSTDITSITTSFSSGDETKVENVVSRLKKEGIVSESHLHEDYLELEFSDGSKMIYPFLPESPFEPQDLIEDLETKSDPGERDIAIFYGYDPQNKKRSAQYNIVTSTKWLFRDSGYTVQEATGARFTKAALDDALGSRSTKAIFIFGHGFSGNVVTGDTMDKKTAKNSPASYVDIGTKVNGKLHYNAYYPLEKLLDTKTGTNKLIYLGCCSSFADRIPPVASDYPAFIIGWTKQNTLGEAAGFILADRLINGASAMDFLKGWQDNSGEDDFDGLIHTGKHTDFSFVTNPSHAWDLQSRYGNKTKIVTPTNKVHLETSILGVYDIWLKFKYDESDWNKEDKMKTRLCSIFYQTAEGSKLDSKKANNMRGAYWWSTYSNDILTTNSGVVKLKVYYFNDDNPDKSIEYNVKYAILAGSFKTNDVDEEELPDVVTFDLDEDSESTILYGRSFKYTNARESGFCYYPKSSPSDVSSIKATGDPVFSAKPSGLESGKTYCAYAYVVDAQGNTHDGNVIEFIAKQDNTIPANPEYVDLGLSVKWATFDVGSSAPEIKGDLFAWGETATKTSYTNDNYVYRDNPTTLPLSSDVAHMKWGGDWRMPTESEMSELVNSCSWTLETINNVVCYRITSKTNGNSIVMPAEDCLRWTSSITTGYTFLSRALYTYHFSDEKKVFPQVGNYNRYEGYPVRPVMPKGSGNIEYVDLGLSVKWATCNLGATKPEDYGDYYAWGETETKTEYTLNNYTFNSYPETLPLANDAANKKWGDKWRMPTAKECQELIDECTWIRTAVNGKKGFKITGKNGNSIFLPAAGWWYNAGTTNQEVDGSYATSSYSPDDDRHSLILFCTSDRGEFISGGNRFIGCTIRPVYDIAISDASSITVTPTDLDFGTVKVGSSATASFTITNTGSTAASVSISAPSAPVTSNVSGTITLNSTEMKTVTLTYSPKEKGSVGGRISVVSGGNTTNVRYSGNAEESTGGYSYEYVDLGLSVKWATCNLGATKPEESGYYFAWGELEPREINSGWGTYKWCNGTDNTFTKYNWRSDYGPVVDNKLVLDLEDDAAHVLLKGNWRMPTWPEWHELIENCTWTQVEINGVPGLLAQSRVTGFTDKSVFFPKNVGGTGFFWTSSMIYDTTSRTTPMMAIAGIVTEYWAGNSWYYRYDIHNIRPVYE